MFESDYFPVSHYCVILTSVFSLSVSVCLGCLSKQETAKFTKHHLRNACKESRQVKCSYALLLIYSSLFVSHITPVPTVTQCKGHFIEMHVCYSKYKFNTIYRCFAILDVSFVWNSSWISRQQWPYDRKHRVVHQT